MYDLKADYPPPLVPREQRFEIAERIGPRGEVIAPLDEAASRPRWSRRVAASVPRRARSASCSPSSIRTTSGASATRCGAALPERASSRCRRTCSPSSASTSASPRRVLNAYLQPVLSRYLRRLAQGLAERAPQGASRHQPVERRPDVGRRAPAISRSARRCPGRRRAWSARSIRRGWPSGANVITLDMGGTSADVCLIRGYGAGIDYRAARSRAFPCACR